MMITESFESCLAPFTFSGEVLQRMLSYHLVIASRNKVRQIHRVVTSVHTILDELCNASEHPIDCTIAFVFLHTTGPLWTSLLVHDM